MLLLSPPLGHVTLWDTRRNTCVMYWRCGTSEIMCLACELHHGNTLSVGLSNNQLQLWRVTTPPKRWCVIVTVMTIICDLFSDQLPVATMESELQLDGSPTGAMFDSDLQLVSCDGSCDYLFILPTGGGGINSCYNMVCWLAWQLYSKISGWPWKQGI